MAGARSLIDIVKRRYHRGWSDPRVARDIHHSLIWNGYECSHCYRLLAAGVIEHECRIGGALVNQGNACTRRL